MPLSAPPTGSEGFDHNAHCGYKLKDKKISIYSQFFIELTYEIY
jgi:hypothetical protein